MNNEWLTLPQIARLLDIAESTARRWAATFGEFLPSRGRGPARRFSPAVVDVFRRIKALYEAGLPTEEVRQRLKDEFTTIIEVEAETNSTANKSTSVIMRALVAELEALRAEARAAREAAESARKEAEALREQLSRLEEREAKRAQKLDELIQAMRERNERKRSFFDRLLGR